MKKVSDHIKAIRFYIPIKCWNNLISQEIRFNVSDYFLNNLDNQMVFIDWQAIADICEKNRQ